eukprot:1157049-Pelagomonas_calceolata.AAC.5
MPDPAHACTHPNAALCMLVLAQMLPCACLYSLKCWPEHACTHPNACRTLLCARLHLPKRRPVHSGTRSNAGLHMLALAQTHAGPCPVHARTYPSAGLEEKGGRQLFSFIACPFLQQIPQSTWPFGLHSLFIVSQPPCGDVRTCADASMLAAVCSDEAGGARLKDQSLFVQTRMLILDLCLLVLRKDLQCRWQRAGEIPRPPHSL